MREKAVCENTNLLDAHVRVQTKRNEPTESRTLKLEPKNLKGRNRRKPEDIVFNNELTQQTNTQSQQVASASLWLTVGNDHHQNYPSLSVASVVSLGVLYC